VKNAKYFAINLSNSESMMKRSDIIDSEYLKDSKYTKKNILQSNFHSNIKSILTSIKEGKFNAEEIKKNPALYNLYKQSIKLHTSFLKSLEVVAARIPSQS
jgi:hypothetical protein